MADPEAMKSAGRGISMRGVAAVRSSFAAM